MDGPQRARGTSPQVIVPAVEPYRRNTRATKGELNLPSTEPAPVITNERRDDDEGHTTARPPQRVLHAVDKLGEHEHLDDPPQSAQKLPEQSFELRKPQASKPRRTRQIKPTRNITGLDIRSDNEMATTERSRPAKRKQEEPSPVEMERRQRRKGTKQTASETVNESVNGLATASAQAPEPTARNRGPSQASKGSGNVEITPGRTDGNGEIAGRARQMRSKTRTKSIDRVSAATAQSGRAQHHHPQTDCHNALDTNEALLNEHDLDEEDDSDQTATDLEDPAQSGGEDESNNQDEDRDHNATPFDIEEVFKFLGSSEHSGRCQTEDAIAIMRACQGALEVLADSDSTLDEVSVITKNIQLMLSTYGADSDGKERKSLKVDAYAYLFRQVVAYLKSLHDWLSQEHSNLQSSLDAMRIITSLIVAILSTKDRIAEWKIRLPSRYKGSRLVKDVDTNLIVPLRRLSDLYLTTLRDLRNEARKRHAFEELARARHEREQREQKKQEMEDLRIQKLNDWIELHVCRLRLEPDPRRRQALRMRQEYFDKKMTTWTDDETNGREEVDADGFPFSRVDLFKKRVVPPASPSSADGEKVWTDEQMGALIDGLESFAGSDVFRNIFQYYCGVGQPLRRFGVPEITAQAVDVRRRLLKTYEERGWTDVPEWVEEIPILP
jgi:hypothetical protein